MDEININLRITIEQGDTKMKLPTITLAPTEQTKAKKPKKEGPSATALTWRAYREGYQRKYGVEPVKNRRIMGQLSQLVSRVGAEMAPKIAQFYLTHHDGFYVKSKHTIGLMLRDAEKLATEYQTGEKTTSGKAFEAERRGDTVDGIHTYLRDKHQGELKV